MIALKFQIKATEHLPDSSLGLTKAGKMRKRTVVKWLPTAISINTNEPGEARRLLKNMVENLQKGKKKDPKFFEKNVRLVEGMEPGTKF